MPPPTTPSTPTEQPLEVTPPRPGGLDAIRPSGVAPPQPDPSHPRLSRLAAWALRLVVLLLALAPLALLYYIFWARLSYPLDLEWMEGGVLVHAQRLAAGHSLYSPPTVDFASFCYTPLHPALLALLSPLTGISYAAGRALSLLAFTATLGFVFRGALAGVAEQRPVAPRPPPGLARTGTAAAPRARGWLRPLDPLRADAWILAFLAAAAIAVAFDFTGGWYDLVRNDSLQVGLSAGGLYWLGRHPSRARSVAFAGLLLGLAFFAKQTAVFPILAAGLGLLLLCPRQLPLLVLVVGSVAGGGSYALNRATHGGYWFYIFDLHQVHETDVTMLLSRAPARLWHHARLLYAAAAAATLAWGAGAVLRRRLRSQTPLWFFGALAGVAAGCVGRATQWSHANAYIPSVIFPAALTAIAAAEARALLAPRAGDPTTGPAGFWLGRGWGSRLALAGPAALLAAHLIATPWPAPERHVPSARQRQQAARLIATLKRLGRDGEVFVPYHPYYSVLAGGPGHGHIMNVNDVQVTRRGPPGLLARWAGEPKARAARVRAARRRLVRSIRNALFGGRFAWVLHDRPVIARWRRQGDRAVPVLQPAYAAQMPGLATHFRPERDLAWDGAAPPTLEGNPTAPRFLWRAPRPAQPPPGGRVLFSFERRTLPGWHLTGRAWGRGPVSGPLWDPARGRAQGLVAGAGGRRWLSSFHGGDAATGTARSPAFRIDRPTLTLRLGGGRDPARLQVRLVVGGAVVRRATGPGSERFATVRWDVSAWRGRRAHLEVVDRATGSWGHLQLDEVWLVP